MTTSTTERSIVTFIGGPNVKWTDGIYRNSYQAAIVRTGDTFTGAVHCLCGRKLEREFKSLDLARAYIDAGIALARQCDPFIEDGHDAN